MKKYIVAILAATAITSLGFAGEGCCSKGGADTKDAAKQCCSKDGANKQCADKDTTGTAAKAATKPAQTK
jgi:hypothetical protein